MNRELPDVQAGFRKGRGSRYQAANIHWTTGGVWGGGDNKGMSEKHLLLIHCAKAFHYMDYNKLENS